MGEAKDDHIEANTLYNKCCAHEPVSKWKVFTTLVCQMLSGGATKMEHAQMGRHPIFPDNLEYKIATLYSQ